MKQNFAILFSPDEADGQAAAQFAPRGFVADAAVEAGADGPTLAVAMLENTDHAEDGSTHSSHTYRELAAEFLLAYAGRLKAPPPALAVKLATGIRQGRAPNDEDWKALHEAWAAWIAEPGHGGK